MLLRILANTPGWVWPLLIFLLALGVQQMMPRQVGRARAMILPVVMTILALLGVATVFARVPAAWLAWCAGMALAIALVGLRAAPAGTSYDTAQQRFHLPGSAQPLLLILGIFLTKYVVSMMLAIRSGLALESDFACAVGALYGIFSGIFVGRAWRLLRLARAPQRAARPARRARPLRLLGSLLAGILALSALLLGGMIAYGTADAPPPLAAVGGAFRALDYSDLPALQTFAARDGSQLAFRAYPASGEDRVAVLIHGSSGDSHAMHALGRALAAAGMPAYALDMRGHGASGRRGDIDHVGQLDEDLADFVARLRVAHPAARIILIGHSSGGGFALRTAGGANRALFDAYLLLAPMLHQSAPTTRPDAGGWVRVYVPRIIALSLLDRLGLPWFQHLPVLAFALPPEAKVDLTRSYSYRLQLNFRPHEDYRADARGIERPTRVLVGAADELFIAEQYAPLLEPLNPQLRVSVLAGVSHAGIVIDAAALRAVVAAAAEI